LASNRGFTSIIGTLISVITFSSCISTTLMDTFIYGTEIVIITIFIRSTFRFNITGTFFVIFRIDREVFATFFAMATVNSTFIIIIARNLDVRTATIGIAGIYCTNIVIITADRGKVASVISTT